MLNRICGPVAVVGPPVDNHCRIELGPHRQNVACLRLTRPSWNIWKPSHQSPEHSIPQLDLPDRLHGHWIFFLQEPPVVHPGVNLVNVRIGVVNHVHSARLQTEYAGWNHSRVFEALLNTVCCCCWWQCVLALKWKPNYVTANLYNSILDRAVANFVAQDSLVRQVRV